MSIDPRLEGAIVVVSLSGGKDSAALSLHLRELGIEHRRVFADTGWEHAWTYEHLDYLAAQLGPIDRVQATTFPDIVRKKGMFPARVLRFCTTELKVRPLIVYHSALHEAGRETISAVGIRRSESQKRATMAEWEWGEDWDAWVWRPLVEWTEADVIAIHQRHGLRPNPLYLAGASRVGCWPCIFASKPEVALVARISPERIDEIERMEADALASSVERHAARGGTLESEGHGAPTMFTLRDTPDGSHRPASVREKVAWAQSGDKTPSMFGEDPHPGCARWGLCESVDV